MKFISFVGGLILASTSPALALEQWGCKLLYAFVKDANEEVIEIPVDDQRAYFSIQDRKLAIYDNFRTEFPLIFDYAVEGNGSRIYELFYTNTASVIQLKGEYKKGSSAKMRITENSDDDYLVVQDFDCLRDF